jgi:hypothetical protein
MRRAPGSPTTSWRTESSATRLSPLSTGISAIHDCETAYRAAGGRSVDVHAAVLASFWWVVNGFVARGVGMSEPGRRGEFRVAVDDADLPVLGVDSVVVVVRTTTTDR